MNAKKIEEYICGIKSEIAPATGCTEPAAVALCAAAAAQALSMVPEQLEVDVSEYIFKNAMNVGIPGTKMTGLSMAAALGALCASPEKKLLILNKIPEENKQAANKLIFDDKIKVNIVKDKPKVYVRVVAKCSTHKGEAVIENKHDNIVLTKLDDKVLTEELGEEFLQPEKVIIYTRNIIEIWEFIHSVNPIELNFLEELITLNDNMASEGMEHPYGLQVGHNIRLSTRSGLMADDMTNYAVSLTAAAADARMSGCEKSVMSVAGSGNQGLTATLPLIAIAKRLNCAREKLYRSLALSILITVHVKRYIGKLSALCGCSIAAAIGVAAGIVYLNGGTCEQAAFAINTMVADISGVVCDGAKPGCALKIATSVNSAVRAAILAMVNIGATEHDGIVNSDVEISLKNLGTLGNIGMNNTNQTILDMMLNKTI